uniref:Uncharacterized protein n=1 Tax=Oryza brachyantha TaxID=4533 RepID=J3LYD3_ORYBR
GSWSPCEPPGSKHACALHICISSQDLCLVLGPRQTRQLLAPACTIMLAGILIF